MQKNYFLYLKHPNINIVCINGEDISIILTKLIIKYTKCAFFIVRYFTLNKGSVKNKTQLLQGNIENYNYVF